jgi:hypothetical protein
MLTKCSPNARVYSFGAQFAPLSQYLSWVQYISQEYKPDVIVVNIVGNDFDESLLSHQASSKVGGVPGMQFFDFSNGSTELVVLPFKQEEIFTQALRHFALAQYLFRNIGIVNIINEFSIRDIELFFQIGKRIKIPLSTSTENLSESTSKYVGNAKRAYTPDKLAISKKQWISF